MAIYSRWPESATKLLICEYAKHSLLYDPLHNDYKNRIKRSMLYNAIADVLTETGYVCTIDDVKAKINGLRTRYLEEKAKILKSIDRGAVGDEVYEPKVYWYYLLNFLDEALKSNESSSNIEEPSSDSSLEYPNILKQESHIEQDFTKKLKRKIKRKSSNFHGNRAKRINKTQRDDTVDTFMKFIGDELRGIGEAGGDAVLRQAKRKMQQVIMQIWDTIDVPLTLPSSHTSVSVKNQRETRSEVGE